MTADTWKLIEDAFDKAIDVPVPERGAWLDANCPDPAIRAEVEVLIAADQQPDYIQQSLKSAVGSLMKHVEAADQLVPGGELGPYQIIEEVGRGGMGTVFRARRTDGVFAKDVAIKAVNRQAISNQVLARFRQERRILGRLDHPHIARVLDGGSTADGVPYLVMDFVHGVRITRYCADNKLTLRARLDLFLKVCSAIQYAHQQMVVHRDLKPSNILVDANGEPHLLDFGIAKLLANDEEAAVLTTDQFRPLTPQYASPEQVRGEEITAATDIYALGLLLHELLTGRPAQPITSTSPLTIAYQVCETDIAPPSSAATNDSEIPPGDLKGDLDDIALLAIRKNPRERYGTVDQLADDIRRHLSHLPVRARAQTTRYRTVKFVRRHATALVAAVLIVASLVGGTLVAVNQARRAERRAQQLRRLANAFIFEVHDAVQNLPGATEARRLILTKAVEQLEALGKEADDPEARFDLASAFRKIGDAVGGVGTANLGDRKAAAGHYIRAESLLEQVVHERPNLAEARIELADVLRRRAILERYSGNPARSRQLFLRSLDAAATLGSPTASAALAMCVVGTLVELSDLERAEGSLKDALASSERAAEIMREAASANPSDLALQLELSGAWSSLAKSRVKMEDLSAAFQAASRSVGALENILARNPLNQDAKQRLMFAYGHSGDILGWPGNPNLGDRAGAEISYGKAVELARGMVASDPKNRRARMDLAIALTRFANVTSPDRPVDAFARYSESEELFEALMRDDPGDANTGLNLGYAYMMHARRQRQAGGMEAASALFRRALGTFTSLKRDSAIVIRNYAAAEREFVELLVKTGRAAEALSQAQQFLAFATVNRRTLPPLYVNVTRAYAYQAMSMVSTPTARCRWLRLARVDLETARGQPGYTPGNEEIRMQVVGSISACQASE